MGWFIAQGPVTMGSRMLSPRGGGGRRDVPAALARLHTEELDGDVVSMDFHTTRHGVTQRK